MHFVGRDPEALCRGGTHKVIGHALQLREAVAEKDNVARPRGVGEAVIAAGREGGQGAPLDLKSPPLTLPLGSRRPEDKAHDTLPEQRSRDGHLCGCGTNARRQSRTS